MKHTFKILIALLSSSFAFAQNQGILMQEQSLRIPYWQEYLHYQIDHRKDTIHRASGLKVEEYLYQEDHYSARGTWQGVDRYLWEGENRLRIYYYDGKEALIDLQEQGLVNRTLVSTAGGAKESQYHYQQGLLQRVSTKKGDSLFEQVYVYRKTDQRLMKIKSFANGEELSVLKFAYNGEGLLQKEELWQAQNLIKMATYSYRQKRLTGASVLNLKSEKQMIRQLYQYQYQDDGSKTTYCTIFANAEDIERKETYRYDQHGRLISKVLEYSDHKELEQEVFLYRYAEKEVQDLEVLNFSKGR